MSECALVVQDPPLSPLLADQTPFQPSSPLVGWMNGQRVPMCTYTWQKTEARRVRMGVLRDQLFLRRSM